MCTMQYARLFEYAAAAAAKASQSIGKRSAVCSGGGGGVVAGVVTAWLVESVNIRSNVVLALRWLFTCIYTYLGSTQIKEEKGV